MTKRDNRNKQRVNVKFEERAENEKIYWKNISPYDVVKIDKAGIFWADNIKLLLQVFL